jgi:hypothetical protein
MRGNKSSAKSTDGIYGIFGANETYQRGVRASIDVSKTLPPCSPVYHYPSSCIGTLLASYMLRQCLEVLWGGDADTFSVGADRDSLFVLQDAAALLSWIEKLLNKCNDLSMAYALDLLSVVATHLQLK